MIRLSPSTAQEKITDDIDWKKIPDRQWEMNFRPLRDLAKEYEFCKRLTIVASLFAAIALVSISVLNGFFPILFGNSETVLLILFASAVPLFLAKLNPQREVGIGLYLTLVLLLLVSNLGLLFMSGYRDEFYSTVFVAIIVPFVLFVLDKVASMYVHWVTASPMLDRATMHTMRGIWKERFGRGLFVPGKVSAEKKKGDADEIDQLLRCIANYPAYLISVIGICLVSIFFVQLLATNLIAQAGLITSTVFILGAAGWIANRDRKTVPTVRSAWMLFATAMTFRMEPGKIQYPDKHKLRLNLFYSAIMVLSFAVNTFWFPWAIGSFTQVDSTTGLIANVAIQFAVVVCLAPVLLFAMAVIALGPVLRAFDQLCETEDALLRNEGWTEFDGYCDRLSKSGIPLESECIWIGFHQQRQFPILIPTSLLNQHVHMLGGSGAGKTGLGLSTLAAQLIRRNEGPVIIIDGKGDNSLFQSVRRWCDEENRKLKWFTTSAEKSTYLFNPIGQSAIERFSLSEIVGFLLNSLNLFHGADYGRGWFTQASKSALAEAAKLKRGGHVRPATFRLFCKHLDEVMRQNEDLEKAATHVKLMMRTLSEFPQLNNGREQSKDSYELPPHPACEHAIDMLEAIKKKQVIYFGFDALTDAATAGELSRMAVYSMISAAKLYTNDTRKNPNVTIIIDEAQNVVASNIANAIELARSSGVGLVFAHQGREQLKTGGTDMRSIFDLCTQVKLYFDAQGDAVNYLQGISREVGYADVTWQQFISDVSAGLLSESMAVSKGGNPALADVKMHVGPRLTVNEIQDAAAAENTCIVTLGRKAGVAQLNGAFPIHIDYPISKDQYEENQLLRWPPKSDETLLTERNRSRPGVVNQSASVFRSLVSGRSDGAGRLANFARIDWIKYS